MKKLTSILLVLSLVMCLFAGYSSAEPAETIAAATLKVGDVISFGHYEQDNDTSNGREEIEWIVLAKDGNRTLVISKYALDCQPYIVEEYEGVTWETCTLRSWLNSDFYHAAFSAEEKKAIVQTNVTPDKTVHCTNPGNSTEDSVFLLSKTEAEKYFSDNDARVCAPTAYAIAQGAYTNSYYNYKTASGEAACCWWMRSPGHSWIYPAYVDIGGSVVYGGYFYTEYACVRPAMWIGSGE